MQQKYSLTARLIFSTLSIALVISGCVASNFENSPKGSLFGGSGRSQKQSSLSGPPSGYPRSIQGEQVSAEASRPQNSSGVILPQLNNALSGNNAGQGLAQPMVSSPLLFQRIDKNTWRVATSAGHLFQTIARVLSYTYIISKADRHALSLSTDWDKFFIDGRLFRNRISVNVFPHSPRTADLIIKNNIEYYTQNAQKADENSPTQWLPTQDITDELSRVLEKTQSQLMAQLSAPSAMK
jgi:hypothetical protein